MTPAPDPERIARLPKWAQAHITRLSESLERLERRHEALKDELTARGTASTPITVKPFEGPEFGLGQDDEIIFHIDVPGLRARGLRVTAHPDMSMISLSGDRSLIVKPSASNRVDVTISQE